MIKTPLFCDDNKTPKSTRNSEYASKSEIRTFRLDSMSLALGKHKVLNKILNLTIILQVVLQQAVILVVLEISQYKMAHLLQPTLVI